MCKQFIGLSFVAAYLSHFQRHKRCEARLKRAQQWAIDLAQPREVLISFAGRAQPWQDRGQIREQSPSVLRFHKLSQYVCLTGQPRRLNTGYILA